MPATATATADAGSRSLLGRLAYAGALPTDTAAVRLEKATLLLAASVIVLLAFVWVGTYLALGLVVPALIPLAYQVLSLAGIAVFVRTKRHEWFRTTHLAGMLVLPFALQASLGGFVNGSGVALWALISPLGALLFHGAREAVPWFVGFLALLAVSGLLEGVLPEPLTLEPPVRATFFVLNGAGPALVAFLLLQYFVRERDREHARSERLLLNILPGPIAERLKADEGVIADEREEVSVLFADLAGFTPVAARMRPEQVIELLNDVFSAFDELTDEHELEKIKTVGDGYLAAAGLLRARPDHARAAADLALAMMRRLDRIPSVAAAGLGLRIGLATGQVVAGVIGTRKFSYDVWGDTVNMASRMESTAEAGTIQVTEETHRLLRDGYDFERRDAVEVKGKGAMGTYVLLGRRPEGEAVR